jgi:membrane-associated phospholipid phosphatase
MNIFFGIVMLGIWFTAIYAGHHYILDVLAGIVCAGAGIGLFKLLIRYARPFRAFTENYEKAIK